MIEETIDAINKKSEKSSERELERIAQIYPLNPSLLLEEQNERSIKKIIVGSSIVALGFFLIPSTEEGILEFLRTLAIYSGALTDIVGGYKLFKSYQIKKRWALEKINQEENKKENKKEEIEKEKKQFYVSFSHENEIAIPKYTSSPTIVEKTYAEKVFPIEPNHPIDYCDPFRNLFLGEATVKEKKTLQYSLEKTITCGNVYSTTYDEKREKIVLILEKKNRSISFMYDNHTSLIPPQIENVQINDTLSLLFQNKGIIDNCFNVDILCAYVSKE